MSDRDSIVLKSYEHAERLHEFFASFRYKVLAYLASVNAALFYFAFTQTLGQLLVIPIATVGILSVIILLLLDIRTTEVMKICIDSGKKIEDLAGIPDGTAIYQMLQKRTPRWRGHGRVITYTCALLITSWLLVLGVSFWVPQLLNMHK